MIDWNKPLENNHGKNIELYGSDRDGHYNIEMDIEGDYPKFSYWVNEEGEAPKELGPDFDVRNVIRRKDKILKEINDMLVGGKCTISGSCPELTKLLEEL